jgi:phasin family protein
MDMNTSSDAMKASVEQATTAGNQAFKDTVEKSLAGLNELNAISKRNMEALVASMTAATKGAEQVGSQAMSYSKRSMEDGVAASKALATAKSMQEVVELQTAYAKTALETYLAEMNRMSETVAASVKDSLAPLNERVTAVMERAQSVR